MRMYDIIEKKRDGITLATAEIDFFVNGYTIGKIPDYQASALLMAIYFQGMSLRESVDLTNAMVDSGETIDLSAITGIKVDKHSTGGVGDSTTLILAPLVASVGVAVPKMSGRGLGHTGGTIDKLEALHGFHVELSTEEFIRLVNENGLAVIGQSGNLTPADKLLYSLRDVTATVNSIPLIASSIMSKKIAAGANKIVLDVKTGSGAFMKTLAGATQLAELMVEIGNNIGRETVAIISNMDEPLGNAVGNALEVKEAMLTLQGQGPEDLTELSLVLASEMVVLAGLAVTEAEARDMLEENIVNGKAFQQFRSFVISQGGMANMVDDLSCLPHAKYVVEVKAEKSGYVTSLHAANIGKAAMMLGAGRETKASTIDLAVGVIVEKKIGAKVVAGDVVFTIHSNHEDVSQVSALLMESVDIGVAAFYPPLIHTKIK